MAISRICATQRQQALPRLGDVGRIRIAIALDETLKSFPRRLRVTFHLIYRGEIEDSRPMVGLLLEHEAKLFDGLIQHLLPKVNKPHIVVNIGKNFSQASGLLKMFEGLIRLTSVVVQQSQIAIRLRCDWTIGEFLEDFFCGYRISRTGISSSQGQLERVEIWP